VCLTLVVVAVSAQYDANGYGGYGGGDAGHGHHQDYYHVSTSLY